MKSPFFIVEEFVSPLMCEDIIDRCNFNVPDETVDGKYSKTSKTSESAESVVFDRIQTLIPTLESYYQLTYKGTERVVFEWFPEGTKGDFVCENSEYIRNKWLRTRARDLTCILFMCDYQESTPFEADYEVYGGKLEFVQHKFGFNPIRGTLVVFPSDPHFINITTPVLCGDLFQARIQMAATTPFVYNPQNYPGDYTSWFKSYL